MRTSHRPRRDLPRPRAATQESWLLNAPTAFSPFLRASAPPSERVPPPSPTEEPPGKHPTHLHIMSRRGNPRAASMGALAFAMPALAVVGGRDGTQPFSPWRRDHRRRRRRRNRYRRNRRHFDPDFDPDSDPKAQSPHSRPRRSASSETKGDARCRTARWGRDGTSPCIELPILPRHTGRTRWLDAARDPARRHLDPGGRWGVKTARWVSAAAAAARRACLYNSSWLRIRRWRGRGDMRR